MTRLRNTRTGVTIDVPEDPPTRTDVVGRDDQWTNHRRRLLASRRWERVASDTASGPGPAGVIPPAYLDPGDGTAPYPVPPATQVDPGDRGVGQPVHPGYQAGPLHAQNPHAEGADDRLNPGGRTHQAFDNPDARRIRRSGEQPDVHGNRPDSGGFHADTASATDQGPDPVQTAQPDSGPDTDGGDLPQQGDRKVEWVKAAQRYGMDQDEAESLNKDDLIGEVRRRAGES